MRRCLNCMNEYEERYGDTCPQCGYVDGVTLNRDVCLRPGTILQGRYIVGTARKARDNDIVYIGWDALFDRKVQLQEYFPRYCATRSAGTKLSIYDSKQERFELGLELFITQSRELIRLYKEEHVITYHACFRENQTAYAVTEYQEEQSLEEWAAGQNLGEREALAILHEAVMAVDAACGVGVTHGMLAPDTFWMTREGRLVLKDFGAWRYVSGEPGVVNYGKAGEETDVYGLARLFCQLLTGRLLEDGDNLEMELLRSRVTLSKDVAAAIKHALSHETRSLYQFHQELGGNMGEGTVHAFSKNRSRRRDARRTFSVPKWVYGVAGAGLAAVVVAAGLILSGVVRPRVNAERNQLEENMVRVPNLVGKSEDEAERLVYDNDLELAKEHMEYSKEIPEGQISYQEIKENNIVEKGTRIVVWVSKGKEKGNVPSVRGWQKEEAVAALEAAGFTNYTLKESQEEGPYNTVLAVTVGGQENPELDNLALDTEILLTICVREEESKAQEVPAEVPELSGLAKADAEKRLTDAGFKMNLIEEFSDQAADTVLGQEPAAGSQADRDTYVTVRVSKGPEKIYMENVKLLSQTEAGEVIRRLGLKEGRVTEAYSDSVPAGKVISQSIPQDAEVSPGQAVDLEVSRGKDPEKVKAAQARAAADKKQKEAESRRAAEAQRQAEAAAEAQRQAEAAAEAQRQAEASGQTDAGQGQAGTGNQTNETGAQGQAGAGEGQGSSGTGGQAGAAEGQGSSGTGGQAGAAEGQGSSGTGGQTGAGEGQEQSGSGSQTVNSGNTQGTKPQAGAGGDVQAGGAPGTGETDPKANAHVVGSSRQEAPEEITVPPKPESGSQPSGGPPGAGNQPPETAAPSSEGQV